MTVFSACWLCVVLMQSVWYLLITWTTQTGIKEIQLPIEKNCSQCKQKPIFNIKLDFDTHTCQRNHNVTNLVKMCIVNTHGSKADKFSKCDEIRPLLSYEHSQVVMPLQGLVWIWPH